MNFKKPGQQEPGGVRKMPTLSALKLRQIRLANRLLHFGTYGGDEFLLSHFAVEATKTSFDQAEVADFFGHGHIAICYMYIANCNTTQENSRAAGC
jgi:hypothetical protein